MSRHWIAVACAEHARRRRSDGFMQVCHGKAAPLRRIQPGDTVAYYSPAVTMGARDGLQSFTAIGRVRDGAPYQAETAGVFCPSRRDVEWYAAEEAPIRPLLGELDFTRNDPRWGYRLRFGLVEIGAADMDRIARAMGVAAMPPS